MALGVTWVAFSMRPFGPRSTQVALGVIRGCLLLSVCWGRDGWPRGASS